MTPMQLDQIEARRERMSGIDIWIDGDEHGDEIRADLDTLISAIRDQERELLARREIMDAIAANVGDGNCWMKAADIDWRQRLRDFASDREQHRISRDDWMSSRGDGITLYAKGGFFVGYYDDAAELWGQSDDTRPMFHVMVASDRPHRTVIHPLHLAAWAEHLADICMPLQIMNGEMVDEPITD